MSRPGGYNAVSAKARTLWGQRLMPEDYRRMASMSRMSEVAAFLRAHPRWGRALEGAELRDIRRAELESRLRAYHLEEFLRLYSFLDDPDRELMRLPVLTLELEQIMRYLRLARTGREYFYQPPPFLARYSKINFEILSRAAGFDGLLEAVSGSAYREALARLTREDGGFPAFARVEVAVMSVYCRDMKAWISRTKDAALQKRLLDALWLRAELQNVTAILRIKTYYPEMQDRFADYLLPVNHKLRPAFVKLLMDAPSPKAVTELLKDSWYGRFLEENQTPEALSAKVLYAVHRRGIHESVPTVVTPLSFLFLTEMELQNIIHIVESVRYGAPPEEILIITGE